jgi:hypothetical protein
VATTLNGKRQADKNGILEIGATVDIIPAHRCCGVAIIFALYNF